MEPSIDNMPQTFVSSVILLMDKPVQLDTFKPPLHNLSVETKQSLHKLLETIKCQFLQDETGIGTTHLI